MHRYHFQTRLLATGLAALAGFVDATAYLSLGGFFVSFMSGNTTRLGVGAALHPHDAAMAGGLIFTFVLGVALGTLVAHWFSQNRATAVLGLVASLLFLAAFLGGRQLIVPSAIAAALAMGAENAVFAREGDVHIGLTYMTGTLVKIGQRIAAALLGGAPFAFLPYLQLWLGLVGGAVLGATLFARFGLHQLWFAAIAAALFAVMTLRTDLKPQTGGE